MSETEPSKRLHANVPDQCPHCGQRLSLWEQVLLSVDRMLICRHCWYRIFLDADHSYQEESEGQ